MSICLCNLSADMTLELMAQEGRELQTATPNLATFSADSALVTEALGALVERLPYPLELLVGNAKDRRSGTGLACHVWQGPLPKGSFFSLGTDVYVTSPELTLLQQAGQLHQVNLCQMLGRYLGTWSPAREARHGQVKRAPLTSLEALEGFVRATRQVRGASNLRLAMAYTCEAAASAPETTLQLVLSLPPELHGFGLPLPIMNYEVELSGVGRGLYGHEIIRIDLCWRDAGFGIEYQGEEHGTQLGKDYARWLAARAAGYELWFVAKEQLDSATQMDYIGREVAQRIGYEVNEALWPTKAELQDLLDMLARRKHAKPVTYDELRHRQAVVREQLRKRH